MLSMHESAIAVTAYRTFHSSQFERPEERPFMTQLIRNRDIFGHDFVISPPACPLV
jgi:hypothetical protein